MHVLNKLSGPCTAPTHASLPRHPKACLSTRPAPSVTVTCRVLRPFSVDNTTSALRRRAVRPSCAAQSAAPTSQQVAVREEQVGPCRLRLHVTVPGQQVAGVYRQTMDQYRKEVRVQGFRKGKAPDASVVAEVGGQQRFNNTVVATLLEATMKQALQPYNDRIIEESHSIDQDGAALVKGFSPQADFCYSVSVDVMPQPSWKRPYRELVVDVAAAGDDASDEAAVQAKLQALRKEGAPMRVVAGRGLQRGDIAIVDIDMLDPESGESLVGGVKEGFRLDTATADDSFLPGVVGLMEGWAVGESRKKQLAMPDRPDLQPASLRGREVLAAVTLKELFEMDLPQMDDAWAEGVAPGCGGVEGLHRQLLEAQRKDTDSKTHKAIEDALLEAVADAVDCPVPDSVVNRLGQQQYTAKLQEALAAGQLSYEIVKQLASEQLLADFIKNHREDLERQQRGLFGFQEIIRDEKLTATLAEIQAEFQDAIASFERFGQEYDKERLMEQVQQQIEGRKAMDWLLENALINVVPYAGPASKQA